MSLKGLSRILRLPLFVTAVADSVAGYTVALQPGQLGTFNWHVAALLAGTSTGLYLFGMVENDVADVRRDRLLKVPRPLVTSEIGFGAATVLLILTTVLVGFCAVTLSGGALVLAIAAFVTINLYNLAAKRGPSYIAMSVMGLCRVLNFAIGVAAAGAAPRHIGPEFFLPTLSLLWVRQGAALFFATAMVAGYSICARGRHTVSSRPWQAVFIVTIVLGIGFWMLATGFISPVFVPPMARVLALVLLTTLWPGGLWSPLGPQRKPAEYSPFIERALYWFIVLDVAFVADGWLMNLPAGR
jgi:4-hydroxybenzoate polyprenyltransferase